MINQMLDLKSSAKVNLTLDITGKLDNGYHTLETIFYEVPIYDTLAIMIDNTRNIDVQCITKSKYEVIPSNENNIAYISAKKFLEAIDDTSHGVSIGILKNIPSQAGLGGGSSNSACVLKSLNRMFGNPLSTDDLIKLGATIGADVPFFIMGGTVYATGIGDVLTPLKPLPRLNMVIAKNLDGVSTPQAYKQIDALDTIQHLNTSLALKSIENQDILTLSKCCGNVFEQITLPKSITDIKNTMLNHNALCSVMTGSGSAVFGIFETSVLAKQCFDVLNVPSKFLV